MELVHAVASGYNGKQRHKVSGFCGGMYRTAGGPAAKPSVEPSASAAAGHHSLSSQPSASIAARHAATAAAARHHSLPAQSPAAKPSVEPSATAAAWHHSLPAQSSASIAATLTQSGELTFQCPARSSQSCWLHVYGAAPRRRLQMRERRRSASQPRRSAAHLRRPTAGTAPSSVEKRLGCVFAQYAAAISCKCGSRRAREAPAVFLATKPNSTKIGRFARSVVARRKNSKAMHGRLCYARSPVQK